MVAFWRMMFVGSLALLAVYVVRGRRRGDGPSRILADSLLIGIPLSISLDHSISSSETLGSVALVGTVLVFLGAIWKLVRSKRR